MKLNYRHKVESEPIRVIGPKERYEVVIETYIGPFYTPVYVTGDELRRESRSVTDCRRAIYDIINRKMKNGLKRAKRFAREQVRK